MVERQTTKGSRNYGTSTLKELSDRILNLARSFRVYGFNPEAAQEYALFVSARCPVDFALSALDTIRTDEFPNPSDLIAEAHRLKSKSRPSDRWVKIERSEGPTGRRVQRVRRVQEGQDFNAAVQVGETLIRTYPGPEGW